MGALVLAVAVAAAGAGAGAHSEDDAKAAAIKAAFVYNFAKFATWPVARFNGPADALLLCVRRDDLQWQALRPLTEKMIGEHPLGVQILDSDVPPPACHIFFASVFRSDASLREALAVAREYGILMVSDRIGFAALGGHIGLVEDRNRLRFQINLGAVAQAGMRLSSRLLQLAEIVGPVGE